MEKPVKVNWVICPSCGYRYYVSTALLLAAVVPAVCPKCRIEFNAADHLEPRFKAALATWT